MTHVILSSGHMLDHFPAQLLMWKGGSKTLSYPWLKIISEGWRQSRGDASYLLEQLIKRLPLASQFHAFPFLSFCFPYILFFFLDTLGKASHNNLGKLGILSSHLPPGVITSSLLRLLTESAHLIRRPLLSCSAFSCPVFGTQQRYMKHTKSFKRQDVS